MSMHTIDVGPLSLRAALGSVDQAARTVELIFSTGAAVERRDWTTGARYLEVLSLDPKHVRLERLNAGAPLLDAHTAWSVSSILGSVEPGSARVDGRQGIARVRFSTRAAVEPIWQDVLDRIISAVSVGYRVHRLEERAGAGDKLPVRTAVDWEPFEVSLVPMPADTGAKVRDGANESNRCVVVACTDDARQAITDADRLRRLRLAQVQDQAQQPAEDYWSLPWSERQRRDAEQLRARADQKAGRGHPPVA